MIKQILQIIPAPPGWVARFEKTEGNHDCCAVACFALVEMEGVGPSIVGYSECVDGFVEADEEAKNFAGYFLRESLDENGNVKP